MCKHAHVSSALALLGLALACGGGGSGSGGGGATAEITADNALAIATDVLDAIDRSADLSTFPGAVPEFYPGAVGAAPIEQVAPFRGLAAALRDALSFAVEPLPSLPGGIAANQVIGPITEICPGGGTRTLSGDVVGTQPTLGDRLDARFDQCIDGMPPSTLDGRFAFTITGLSGNVQSLFSLALALTLDEFSEEMGDVVQGMDGDANTGFNNVTPPFVFSSARGASLRFTTQAAGPNPPPASTLNLRGYQTILSQDIEEEDYSIEGDGEVSSSSTAYTGRVVYDTAQNLSGLDGELPSEGVVDVLGLNDSALRIVPVTGFNVDFGTLFAPPPRSYAAAAAQQAGRWTQVGLDDTTLVALIGGDSEVRVTLSDATASGAVADDPVTNDSQRLLFDHFSSPGGATWTVTLSGLTQGSYRVFLYAPSDPAVVSGDMTVGGVDVASISGDPDGSLIQGTSWLFVDVAVAGGTLVITGTAATASGLAGLQIVPNVPEAVNLEVDADGDGEFETTDPTSWTELGF